MKQLLTIIILFLLSACTSINEDNDKSIEDKNYTKADYITDVAKLFGLAVNKKGEVFYFSQDNKDVTTPKQALNKIDLFGNKKILTQIDNDSETFTGLSYFRNNEILYLKNRTKSLSNYEFLVRYNIKSTAKKDYEIKYLITPPIEKRSMRVIANYTNNTILFFDSSLSTLRKYSPLAKTDILLLPSNSFVDVNMIKTHKGVIYLEDSGFIKKVVKNENTNQFKITALAKTPEGTTDMDIDALGNILVIIPKKGIFKLNSNNTFEKYLTGTFRVKTRHTDGMRYIATDYASFTEIEINGKDLFLSNSDSVIKISDYKSKLIK